MKKDYLQAYLAAAMREEAIRDEEFRRAVEARAMEIARRMEAPYHEAMRLQSRSREARRELLERIEQGEQAPALLPLALETISALCGDEAFYRACMARLYESGALPLPHARSAQRAAGEGGDAQAAPHGDMHPDARRPAGEGDSYAAERRDLQGRAAALRAFIADTSIPAGERQSANERLLLIERRLAQIAPADA